MSRHWNIFIWLKSAIIQLWHKSEYKVNGPDPEGFILIVMGQKPYLLDCQGVPTFISANVI